MARRRLSSGQSLATAISATDWNDLLALLDYRDANGLWDKKRPITEPQHREHKGTQFLCRNSTGRVITFGGILGVETLGVDQQNQYNELNREITLTGIVPTKKHLGAFAVALEPIDVDRFGPVAIAGGVPCKVNINDKDHKFCEMAVGSTAALESCVRGSAQIIWKAKESGAGVWCVVRLCNYVPPVFWKAKAKEAFCPEDLTADFEELEPLDGCIAEDPPDEVEADNEESLAACLGDQVVLVRNFGPEDTGWWILQTKHKMKLFATTMQYTSCEIQIPKDYAVVMSCCKYAQPDIIPMYEHTYVSDAKLVKAGYTTGTASGQQTCTIQLQTSTDTFCAFEPYTPSALANRYDAIVFSGVHVIVDVIDDTDCIQKIGRWVYVLCYDDTETAEDVICREACP